MSVSLLQVAPRLPGDGANSRPDAGNLSAAAIASGRLLEDHSQEQATPQLGGKRWSGSGLLVDYRGQCYLSARAADRYPALSPMASNSRTEAREIFGARTGVYAFVAQRLLYLWRRVHGDFGMGASQQFTEKERLLVGLIGARWQDRLTFAVDSAWFRVSTGRRSWEIGRSDLDQYYPPELDALARRALLELSNIREFWPPLQRVFQSQGDFA